MSFAINPSLNYLHINEAYILEFYRSASAVTLPDARFRGHPFEAYICITKIDSELRAYVALLNTGLQSVLVYTSDFTARKTDDYQQVIAEAEKFACSMGFMMERVNLDFSPAMREVILKGFRVMRPPPPPKKQIHRQPKVDVPVTLGEELDISDLSPSENPEDRGLRDTRAELKAVRAELVSVRVAVEQVTREKVLLEQQLSQRLLPLQSALEQALEAKRVVDNRLAEELSKQSTLEEAGQNAGAERLKLELVKLNQACKEKIHDLQTELDLARKGSSDNELQLRQELEEMSQRVALQLRENRILEQRHGDDIAAFKSLIAKGNAEKEAIAMLLTVEKDANLAAAAKLAELSHSEQLREEGEQHIAELRQKLSALEAELSTLNAAQESLNSRAVQEEDLMLRLAEASGQLELARAELEDLRKKQLDSKLLSENITKLKDELALAAAELENLRLSSEDESRRSEEFTRIVKEKESVEAEYVRLANLSRMNETELADRLASAEAENDRLSRELTVQGQVAAVEQSALRTELHRLVAERGEFPPSFTGRIEQQADSSAVSPVAAALKTDQPEALLKGTAKAPYGQAGSTPGHTLPASDAPHLSASEEEPEEEGTLVIADPDIIKSFINEFGGIYISRESSATEFRIDPAVNCIKYSDPGEVVAAFQSCNTVQAVPDGSSIQQCRGFVIALKQSGSYQVYVAWQLVESGKVVVCVPDQQPVDSDNTVMVIKDAIAYFEIVGFMMDVIDLGTSFGSYCKELKKSPLSDVLKKF